MMEERSSSSRNVLPSTPPRSRSEGPASKCRDYSADERTIRLGDSVRKRPRLEAQITPKRRSISADRLERLGRGTTAELSTLSRNENTLSSTFRPNLEDQNATNVTLNIKDGVVEQVPSDSSSGLQVEEKHDVADAPSQDFDRPTSPEPSALANSPSITPEHSPEIQIAEVEDASDEASHTRWRPLKNDTISPAQVQRDHLSQFPGLGPTRNLLKALQVLGSAFERYEISDGQLFASLADWIEQYLDYTQVFEDAWCELIMKDQPTFWTSFPVVIESFCNRVDSYKGVLTQAMADNTCIQENDALARFLESWAALSIRMVRADLSSMSLDLDSKPRAELISDKYLCSIAYLIRADSPVWVSMNSWSQYDTKRAIRAMVNRLVRASDHGLPCLRRLAATVLDMIPEQPQLATRFTSIFWTVSHLAIFYRSHELDNSCNVLRPAFTAELQGFFETINPRLQSLIDKQSSGLTISLCQTLVSSISELINTLVILDDTAFLTHEKKLAWDTQVLSRIDASELIQINWKLETLKKCVMQGRMEIRAQGIENLQQELVTFHSRFVDGMSPPHRVAIYIADYLVQNEFVRYLVGPESHPQLILRSSNIINFLLVTNKFQLHDMDMIWSTIANGQDSRTSEAILTMLTHCVPLCNSELLLLLISKFGSLSLSTFDAKMLAFMSATMRALTAPGKEGQGAKIGCVGLVPLRLCIQLIYMAVPGSSHFAEGHRDLHEWACTCLLGLLGDDLELSKHETLFSECFAELKRQPDTAMGSISAMACLLSGNNTSSLMKIFNPSSELTDLMIVEYSAFTSSQASGRLHNCAQRIQLTIRLDFLQALLMSTPNLLPPLSKEFWDCSVGIAAIDDRARDMAWDMFVNMKRNLPGVQHLFIAICATEFLPKLSPQHLTPGSLRFAAMIQDEIHQVGKGTQLVDTTWFEQEAELFWHLVLVVPSKKNDLEEKAIAMLVKYYLDSPNMDGESQEKMTSILVGVVAKCIKWLSTSAMTLAQPDFPAKMNPTINRSAVIDAPPSTIFLRSLTVLEDFILGVRTRPIYSPRTELVATVPGDFNVLQGEPVQIRYQAFSRSRPPSNINTFDVGSEESVLRFCEKISLLTGFAKFNAILGGAKLDLDDLAASQIANLNIPSKGLLLIRETTSQTKVSTLSNPLEHEILRHFDDLFDLLGLEETFSQRVYDILTALPSPSAAVARVTSKDISTTELLPLLEPHKAQYSLFVMRAILSEAIQQGKLDLAFISQSISHLCIVLNSITVDLALLTGNLSFILLEEVMECMAFFFKTSQNSQSLDPGFPRSLPEIAKSSMLSEVVSRCLDILQQIKLYERVTQRPKALRNGCLDVLLEVCSCIPECWHELKAPNKLEWLMQWIFLENEDLADRQALLKIFKGRLHNDHLKASGFALRIIGALFAIIPDSTRHHTHAEQFFDLLHILMASLTIEEISSIEISDNLNGWLKLLLDHNHHEIVGRHETNYFVFGICRLLNQGLDFAISHGFRVDIEECACQQIMSKFLLTDTSDVNLTPVLDHTTRTHLYGLVLTLASIGIHNLEQFLDYYVGTYPNETTSPQAWSWGIAQPSNDDSYDRNWAVDRLLCIRSSVGYPGLRNLSNTCYMNSLLTQLFMNHDFRAVIMSIKPAQAVGPSLIQEIQAVFGFLNGSYLRCVDTQSIADAIVTYDSTPLDINVQVDVEEFYNLLFDRLESQLPSKDEVTKFRSIYGGFLVQQIKSKECDHVSERLEPFSAIQCEVSGRRNLMESLEAYVQGEAMEGDNKYSCTSCGKYVDAVKRACIKDLPNNLIFHLKRFDYDLMNGTRAKINDRFEFPFELDMAPYKVENLQHKGADIQQDCFTLVGVLVHSGTADSGHYYSYVSEQLGPNKYRWIEFNDQDVTEFNADDIDAQCFGGWADNVEYEASYPKLWNAYMLFYERVESSAAAKTSVVVQDNLVRKIEASNNAFLREYCMVDPSHAEFIGLLLSRSRLICLGAGSSNRAEKQALGLALDLVAKVLPRVRDVQAFDEMMERLKEFGASFGMYAKAMLVWLTAETSPLRDLLLRCPHSKVRTKFAKFVSFLLQEVRSKDAKSFGFLIESGDDDLDLTNIPRALSTHSGFLLDILLKMKHFWEILHLHAKAWDNYFGLLVDVVSLGPHEALLVLQVGFLKNLLEIILCNTPAGRSLRSHPPYSGYTRLLDKGRKFSLIKLTEVMACLFERIDFGEEPLPETCQHRLFYDDGFQLSEIEHVYIHHRSGATNKGPCLLLDRIISSDVEASTTKRILVSLLMAPSTAQLGQGVYTTIKGGVNFAPAALAAPYLQAALIYCEYTYDLGKAERLIQEIAGAVHSIDDSGGQEHLLFFHQARRLRSMHDELHDEVPYDFFETCVLRSVPAWAPYLLCYWELEVRQGVRELLELLIFQHDETAMDDEERADLLESTGRLLCEQCIIRCELSLAGDTPIKTSEFLIEISHICIQRYFGDLDEAVKMKFLMVLDSMKACAVASVGERNSCDWGDDDDDAPSDSEFNGGMVSS